MSQKDIVSKGLLKHLLVDMARYLLRLDLIDAELLSTEEQRIEDRRADLVAKVKPAQGDRFILHLEIQNANDGQMPVRMLRYLTAAVRPGRRCRPGLHRRRAVDHEEGAGQPATALPL